MNNKKTAIIVENAEALVNFKEALAKVGVKYGDVMCVSSDQMILFVNEKGFFTWSSIPYTNIDPNYTVVTKIYLASQITPDNLADILPARMINPVTEMTVKEIAEKLGVKNLKIVE